MKDWIGQAGMLSAAGFTNGASCLNLSCLKRDKQSAITLLAPSMCTIHTLMLCFAAAKYSKRTKAMVSLARVEPDFQMSTTA